MALSIKYQRYSWIKQHDYAVKAANMSMSFVLCIQLMTYQTCPEYATTVSFDSPSEAQTSINQAVVKMTFR